MTDKKVLETLEKSPTGLSISEIAEKSKLHRNTVATVIKKLQDKGEVELKKVGLAKVYYLKKYSGLHKMESGYKGKNISVGIGISDLQKGYQAAISASKQAAMQSSKGANPSFSLVFVSSKYNPQIKEIVKGINKILGKNWIGCTTDKEINSVLGYSEGTVEVLCINSKYMHFGVGLSEDYRKNPVEEGKKITLEAIRNCPADRSKFATAQFMRGTKKGFADIVKNPPYFVLSFPGGTYFKNKVPMLGLESEFLDGIKEVLSNYIPIIGGSAASDFDKLVNYEGENYVFANGNYYKKGAVVAFVVSELYFSYGMEHGYIPTDKHGRITKVSGNGKIIEEINGKPAVDEYCRLVGINKKEFLKASMKYQCINPILVSDTVGNIFPIAIGANPDEKTLFSYQKLRENVNVGIGKYNEDKSLNATPNYIREIRKDHQVSGVGLQLLFSCIGRRIMLKERVSEVLEKINVELGGASYIGFYSNGEIGAIRNQSSRYNNFTDTFFIVFDKLMTE